VGAEGRDGAEDDYCGVRARSGAEVVDEGGEHGGPERGTPGVQRGKERGHEWEEVRAAEAVQHAGGERVVLEAP